MKRRGLVIGSGLMMLVVGLLLVGGNVFAQSATPAANSSNSDDFRQAYINAAAAELGVSSADFEAAMTAGELAVVDQMGANARARIENGEGLFPFGGRDGGRDGGRHHGRDRGGDRFDMGMRDGSGMSDMATFLGITENDLKASLKGGDTLAEIATANGKTLDELRTFLIQQATDRIDQRLQETTVDNDVDVESTASPAASVA